MIKLHPKIFEYLIKSYYYVGSYSYEYLLETLEVLPLSKKFNLEEAKEKERKKENEEPKSHLEEWESITWRFKEKQGKLYEAILECIKSLNNDDIYRLLLVILPDTNFEKMVHDGWNCWGENVEDWNKNLIHYLDICGIKYDSEKRQLISSEGLDIQRILAKSDLISIKFEDIFYRNLNEEINKCYKMGAYTTAFILSRKLLENLVIDILRGKFPQSEENLKIYYRLNDHGKDGRFHDFMTLLRNLDNKKKEFGIDKEVIEEFLRLIKPFRPTANSNAHSIIIQGDKETLDKLQIENMAGLLVKILRNIKD